MKDLCSLTIFYYVRLSKVCQFQLIFTLLFISYDIRNLKLKVRRAEEKLKLDPTLAQENRYLKAKVIML